MSLTYLFKSGKHKGKQLKWVKKNDLNYLKDITSGKIKIKIAQKIKDFIEKMSEIKPSPTTPLIDEAIELYKDGKSRKDIFELLVEREYTPSYVNFVLDSASSKVIQGFEEDKSYLIGLHLKRYDDTYSRHMSTAAALIGHKHKYKRIDHYILAMDSLTAKERLLGLYGKKYNIQLNNFFNRDRDQASGSGYNFEALTTEELVELSELIEGAKVVNNEDREIRLFNEAIIQTEKITQDIIEKTEENEEEREEVESPLTKVTHKDIFGSKLKEQQKKTGNTIDAIEEKIKQSNKSALELIMNKQRKREDK